MNVLLKYDDKTEKFLNVTDILIEVEDLYYSVSQAALRRFLKHD